MRAVVTGQVGVDKGPYLEAVKQLAVKQGMDIEVFKRRQHDVPRGARRSAGPDS